MAINIPKQPYGLTLPISHGDGGYFNQSYTVADQVKSNLINLLNTKKGERRMNPTFGSDLNKVIFEFGNDEIIPIIDSTVRQDIQTWMPYLTVSNVSVDISNEYLDTYAVHIQISFTINQVGISEVQTVDFVVDKQIL